LPPDQPSIFATATAASAYLGPVPRTPPHESLLAVMGETSPNVAVAAARARGRAAMLLVADELSDATSGMRWLDRLARAAGEGLGRLMPR
jgi:hypothetical protein